jgi:hypothetical protein
MPIHAHIAQPLTKLTKKNITFHWTDQCQQALDTLISILLDDPNLTQPDPSRLVFKSPVKSGFFA